MRIGKCFCKQTGHKTLITCILPFFLKHTQLKECSLKLYLCLPYLYISSLKEVSKVLQDRKIANGHNLSPFFLLFFCFF